MSNLTVHANQRLTSLQESICDDLSGGLYLQEAAKKNGLTVSQLQRMRIREPVFDQAVSRARALSIDAKVDDLHRIAEETPDVQRARLISENIRWAAGKLHPKVYGDKLDLTITERVDLGSALAEARARILRPLCDPVDAIEAQFIDLTEENVDEAVDTQSTDDADDLSMPDIFS